MGDARSVFAALVGVKVGSIVWEIRGGKVVAGGGLGVSECGEWIGDGFVVPMAGGAPKFAPAAISWRTLLADILTIEGGCTS